MAPRKNSGTPRKTGREVAKNPKGGAPARYDYGQYSGVGGEDITPDDFLLPFVRIAQTNAPQLVKRGDRYVSGLEAGEFFNISTQRVYGGSEETEETDPFVFYVCAKLHAYPEFVPRDAGGGFVGQRSDDDPTVVELRAKHGKFGKLINEEDGTELVETYYLYCLVPPDEDNTEPEPIVLPLSSTGITPTKQLLMQLNGLINKGIPIFGARVRASTRWTKNTEGEFFKPTFTLDGDEPTDYLLPPNDPLLEVCADLRNSVLSGAAKVDFAQSRDYDLEGEVVDEEPEEAPAKPARASGRARGAKAAAAF